MIINLITIENMGAIPTGDASASVYSATSLSNSVISEMLKNMGSRTRKKHRYQSRTKETSEMAATSTISIPLMIAHQSTTAKLRLKLLTLFTSSLQPMKNCRRQISNTISIPPVKHQSLTLSTVIFIVISLLTPAIG